MILPVFDPIDTFCVSEAVVCILPFCLHASLEEFLKSLYQEGIFKLASSFFLQSSNNYESSIFHLTINIDIWSLLIKLLFKLSSGMQITAI